mmetsp:Transcript_29893/g.80336  ORF Transcript_29893/g.80336 Transcript_29893/m.80336 type:complete len:291 (+) Transcript_29893:94-966(+)
MAPKRARGGGHAAWHKGKVQRARDSEIAAGMHGILVTCDVHAEKNAIRDMFNVLNALWEDLTPTAPAADQGAPGRVSDPAADVAREMATLTEKKRFFVAQTNCPGTMMLRVNNEVQPQPEMLQVVNAMFNSVLVGGDYTTRYVARCLPCQLVCKAEIPKMLQGISEVLSSSSQLGKGRVPSFAVQFKKRQNSTLDREEVIKAVADHVSKAFPGVVVNIGDPALCVCIEVIRTVCCICMVDGWAKYTRYSLRALAGDSGGSGDKEDQPKDRDVDAAVGKAALPLGAPAAEK